MAMNGRQKRAIIMGATSGIGLEMVKVLTAQGWQVGIAGRRQERLQQIQSKNLDVVATECIDITKEDAPRRLLTLIGKTGGMDLYFHSAGIGYQNPALDQDKEMETPSSLTHSVSPSPLPRAFDVTTPSSPSIGATVSSSPSGD